VLAVYQAIARVESSHSGNVRTAVAGDPSRTTGVTSLGGAVAQRHSRYLAVSEERLPALVPPPPAAALQRELRLAERYAESALAPATRRAYERDWLTFARWCAERGLRAIPAAPATVAAFLAAEADREFRPVTIARRAPAIAAAHRAQDQANPGDSGAVAAVMSGIRRAHGTEPRQQAKPLELDPLGRLLEPIDATTLAGLRDRALILLGFSAALRRSELVALDVQDLRFDLGRGLTVTIRRSKTDQEREGQVVAVPCARARDRCAVRAPQECLHAAAIHRGAVFRQMRRGDTLTDRRLSDQSVALIIKKRARAAGLPHTELLSGHSLRAGYATTAAAADVEERKAANVTRHKNITVLRGYIRRANRLRRRRRGASVS
jgi:site-specific recombinase XerD